MSTTCMNVCIIICNPYNTLLHWLYTYSNYINRNAVVPILARYSDKDLSCTIICDCVACLLISTMNVCKTTCTVLISNSTTNYVHVASNVEGMPTLHMN